MAKLTHRSTRERVKRVAPRPRGRPPGKSFNETIPVRLTPAIAADVRAWAYENELSRSEAIRRLVEIGLKRGKR